jgi:S1-C subfamily serine protease
VKQHFRVRSLITFFIGILLLSWLSVASFDAKAQSTDTPIPSAASSLTPTLLPTPTLSLAERVTLLEEKVALPKKDRWDIFKIITDPLITLLTGVGVAIFGIWATRSFNNRQLDAENIRATTQLKSEELRAQNQLVSEENRAKEQQQIAKIQTVEAFMPQLKSDKPRDVEAALLSIASLDPELSARLGSIYSTRTDGAISALSKMASSGNEAIAEAAERSLGEIYQHVIQGIVQVSQGNVVRGSGFFVRQDGYIVTTHNVIAGQAGLSVTTVLATLPAEVVKVNEQDNLALIRASGSGFATLPAMAQEYRPALMEEIILIGYDIRVGITVTVGKYTGEKRSPEYPRSHLLSVNVMAPRTFGGAVALDKNGRLLGMVVSFWLDQPNLVTTAYVLPARSLAEFVSDSIPK